MNVLEELKVKRKNKIKSLAMLIDPDKFDRVEHLLSNEHFVNAVDYILIGGSLMITDRMSEVLSKIKSRTDKPLLIFPSSSMQICSEADAFLLLTLISGRNPDFLIGRHVESAVALRSSGLEMIATGYMLIDGGKPTTASYISNTTSIPSDKPEIATATAMAGEMLGLSLIYMDAGSGASHPVSEAMIKMVHTNTDLPIITGGGIRSAKKVFRNFQAGADMVVVGNMFESDPEWSETFLLEYLEVKHQSNLIFEHH